MIDFKELKQSVTCFDAAQKLGLNLWQLNSEEYRGVSIAPGEHTHNNALSVKRDVWYDHTLQHGGDVIDLVAFTMFGTNDNQSRIEAAKFLAGDSEFDSDSEQYKSFTNDSTAHISKPFTLSVAVGVRQNVFNKEYGHVSEIRTLHDLQQAVLFDNTCCIFKNNYRKTEMFIQTDVICMDCDNDHEDNPENWLTPEKLAFLLPDVLFLVVYSRHHMKDKPDTKGNIISPRPRWHVYFPLSRSYSEYNTLKDMKELILQRFPEFDSAAKDVTRLLFGVENPICELHEGTSYIDEFLSSNRNSSQMRKEAFKEAMSAINQFGITDKAKNSFNNSCSQFSTPITAQDRNSIWNQAVSLFGQAKGKSQKKRILTLPVIENSLKQFNIEVKYDVITHRVSISDLPSDNPFVPESYFDCNKFTRAKANIDCLPLFLNSYLKEQNFSFSAAFIQDALNVIATTHSVNPFLDMLKNTIWDGKNRVYELCQVLGITSEDYHYIKYFEKWLWQVVSMALNDDGSLGNEFVLVLQGKQGIGKTSFFRKLAVIPDWFAEGASIDMKNKDTIIEAVQVLICELGELEATLNRDQPSLKAFLTRPQDVFRLPYARTAQRYERRTSFCGSVNQEQFLRDTTGSRRFVIIPVSADMDKQFIQNEMTPEYTAQLWRQVYEQYYLKRGRNGFYLTDDERQFSENNNIQANVPVDGEVELYDLLDWEQPIDMWKWCTCSEIIKNLELRISAKKLGIALTAIHTKDHRVTKKHANHGQVYFIPPKKNMC